MLYEDIAIVAESRLNFYQLFRRAQGFRAFLKYPPPVYVRTAFPRVQAQVHTRLLAKLCVLRILPPLSLARVGHLKPPIPSHRAPWRAHRRPRVVEELHSLGEVREGVLLLFVSDMSFRSEASALATASPLHRAATI